MLPHLNHYTGGDQPLAVSAEHQARKILFSFRYLPSADAGCNAPKADTVPTEECKNIDAFGI